MTITIRPARSADESRCLELLSLLRGTPPEPEWANVFRALLNGERGLVLVADEAGALLGSAAVSFNLAMRYGGIYCQLEELIVDPTARGRNLGGRLLEGAISAAKAKGAAEFGLYLLQTTTHNRLFYKKFGLQTVGDEMRMTLESGKQLD
jgi:GNAT superfamily N-acetyltransferase